jgi:hypothetical protein
MNTPFQVEVLRLHCEHLRTLLDRVISELTTMEHELDMDRHPSFATIAPHMNGLEKQSEKIAVETIRFQSFLQSLEPQSPDASEAARESPQASTSSTSETSKGGDIKALARWTAKNQQ